MRHSSHVVDIIQVISLAKWGEHVFKAFPYLDMNLDSSFCRLMKKSLLLKQGQYNKHCQRVGHKSCQSWNRFLFVDPLFIDFGRVTGHGSVGHTQSMTRFES